MVPDHTVTYESTWKAMEALQDGGLTRAIGVSNIGCVKIVDVLKYCRIKPAVLQVEMHPFLTQVNLLKFTQSLGIQVMAFSNLGSLSYVSIGLATENDTCMLSPAVIDASKKYEKTAA
jgi:D-xylose reductase